MLFPKYEAQIVCSYLYVGWGVNGKQQPMYLKLTAMCLKIPPGTKSSFSVFNQKQPINKPLPQPYTNNKQGTRGTYIQVRMPFMHALFCFYCLYMTLFLRSVEEKTLTKKIS